MAIFNQILLKDSTRLFLMPKQELFFSRIASVNMMDAIFWVNSAAKIIWVNDAVCSLTEYAREELLSMNIYDLNLDLARPQWSKYQADLEQEEFLIVECFHCTKKGQIFPIELKIASVEYEGQKYNCILLRDISQPK